MGYIKYENLKTEYSGVKVRQFKTQSGGKGVELIWPDGETLKVSTKGFRYFTNDGIKLGDYTDMTTIYRQDYGANGYMLSSDGTTYVEPVTYTPEPIPEPEPYVPTETELRVAELNSIIEQNKVLLLETDYKVIKNSEYTEAGREVEYEPIALNVERQSLRDAINAAEEELKELISEGVAE